MPHSRTCATLPMRLGGLGLRSADRTAPAAYGASWADAMPMLSRRLPQLTTHIIDEMARGPQACARLDRSGFISRPGCPQLRAGERPPPPGSTEPGEWQHGWQYHASFSLECHFRETVVLAQSCSADQAHLRSHSGPGTGEVLHCSAHWYWSGCVSRWTSLSRNASVDVSLTQLEGTGQLARDVADSAQEQSVPKGLWQECAGKQGPQFASIPSSVM